MGTYTILDDEAPAPERSYTVLPDDTAADSPGWLKSLATSAEKGVGNIAEGLAGGIKFAEDKLGTGTGIGDYLLNIEDQYQQPREELLSQVEQGSPQYYANRITEGLTSSVPLLAATGPVSALAIGGAQGLGSQYQRMLDEGAPEDAATKSALLMGGINALSSVPIAQTAQAAAPLLSRMGSGALWGGALSVPQTIGQAYADAVGTGHAVKPYDLIDPIKENALIGGATGALLPAVYETGRKLSKVGKGVNAKELGAQLRERMLSKYVDDPNAIMPAAEAPAVPEGDPAPPPKTLELPEPDPVVEEVKLIKPATEESSFPTPVDPQNLEVAVRAEKNNAVAKLDQNAGKTDPLAADSSAKLTQLSEDPVIKELSDTQAWFEGGVDLPFVDNAVKVPGVSKILSAWRKNFTMPKTISDKFPEVRDIYYKGGRAEVENEALVSSELGAKVRPYFEADNPELVDAYIGQLGEITKQFQRERSAEIANLRKTMQEASDITAGKTTVTGDVEAQKQYANDLVQKAQSQLNEIEKRATPRPTTEDMKALGLSDRDVAAVNAHQETMNYAADVILRDVFKLQGRKISDPVKKAEYDAAVDEYVSGLLSTNYFPARRYGKSWTAYAKDEKGNTLWRVDVDSKRSALKAASEYKLENKDARLTVEAKPEIDMDAFPDMPSNLMDAIQTFRPDKWTENAKNKPPTGFTRYLVEAQKIPGYDPNIRQSTLDYILSLSRYYGRQKAKAITDDIVNSLPEGSAVRGFAKRYADSQLVTPENSAVKGAMKFQNLTKLAGVPLSALINTTQTFTTTIPKLEAELVKAYGYKGALIKQPQVFARVTKDVFGYLTDRLTPKLSSARKNNPELYAFIDHAQKIGVLESEGLRELYNLRAKLAGKPTAADSLMFMFSAAEQSNRLIALLAGREAGIAQGLKGEALQEYAKKFVIDTQFDQTVANRPPAIARGVPRLMTQYRPFQFNYIRFLRNNVSKDGLPALGLSLGAMIALGGIKAIPGIRDMEKLAEEAGLNPTKYVKGLFTNQKAANAVLTGLPTLGGISISGAVSPGEFIPEMDLKGGGLVKVLGPSADYFVNQLPKAASVLSKNEDPVTAYEIAGPRFTRGPLKALRAATDPQGLTNTKGDTLISNPTGSELTALALGATPQRLQDSNEYISDRWRLTDQAKDQGKDWNSLFAQAIRLKDKKRLNELWNEVQSLNATLPPERQITINERQIYKELMPGWARDYNNMPKKARAPLARLMKEYNRLPAIQKIPRTGVEEP